MRQSKWVIVGLGVIIGVVCIVAGMIGCAQSSQKYHALRAEPVPGLEQLYGLSSQGYDPGRSRTGLSVPAVPVAGEELWIIQKPAEVQAPESKAELPGTGSLMAQIPSAKEPVPVPLKRTDVKASITGCIATVDVAQQYHNPYDTKVEAVYAFPLPHDAAVSEFVMTVGERRIRGIIREREEAQRIYQEARSQGYVASLLTQERPNIFTQKVANIEPGKQIDVNIRYFSTLAYVDGFFEFVFPMVVGPRFNPPGSSEGVGAVARDARGVSGQKTEVAYLRPSERSGHDISLSVDIDAGVQIENLICRSHRIEHSMDGAKARVAMASDDRIPNRDFVLRYQVAGKTPKTAVFTARDQRGGYFAMMLVPPIDQSDLPRQPLEMVFTMDVSGSMSGRPIEQSKSAVKYALRHMNAGDTFQIIRFENSAEKLFDRPVPADPANVSRALSFVEQLQGGGGTMMTDGMRACLAFPHEESRLRYVAFLTDGFIGNEPDILREVHNNLGPSRIFSFGVGSSTNRYLLEHMAKMGRGAAAFLGLNDSVDEVMAAFFDRISHPALTNISIDFGQLNASQVYPQRVPDLFVGRPVMVFGRFNGAGEAMVRIKGIVGGQVKEISVPVDLSKSVENKAVPMLWARAKIADVLDEATWNPNGEFAGEIKRTSLEYGLMSPFTAFLAVDASQRTAGEHGVTVGVPVPVPEGVKYETTVQEKKTAVGRE